MTLLAEHSAALKRCEQAMLPIGVVGGLLSKQQDEAIQTRCLASRSLF